MFLENVNSLICGEKWDICEKIVIGLSGQINFGVG